MEAGIRISQPQTEGDMSGRTFEESMVRSEALRVSYGDFGIGNLCYSM